MVRTRQHARRNAPGLSTEDGGTHRRRSRVHSRVQFARELRVSAQAVMQWDAAVTLLSDWSSKMTRRPYRRWFQELTSADSRLAAATGSLPRPSVLSSFALRPALGMLGRSAAVSADVVMPVTLPVALPREDVVDDVFCSNIIIVDDNGDCSALSNNVLTASV